mgnify:CR=1 FL=1
MKLSFNTMIWVGESQSERCERLRRYGYNGGEFAFGLEEIDFSEVCLELRKRNLKAASVGCQYLPGLDLSSADVTTRRHTIEYSKRCVRAAHEVGASVVNSSPTAGLKITPEINEQDEWNWAVESLREIGQYADKRGIQLAIESWNRYETYMLLTAQDVLQMINDIDLKNVGGMLDTFHMNIEDASLPESIRLIGDRLYNVHFADSNRAAPGQGHIDFLPVLQALKDISYGGFISLELIPAAGDPFAAARSGNAKDFFDKYAKQSATVLRKLATDIGY